MNQNKCYKYEVAIEATADVLHLMKCNRGKHCPCSCCRSTSNEDKKRYIKSLIRSPGYKHYIKCRETKESAMILMRKKGLNNMCLCGFIRGYIQQVHNEYFPSAPMKLQLLAACAVPTEAIHEACIHTEGLIRLENSARCIQRQWRSYLQARGPGYRTRICKFYMPQGCRRGVHCTYAHGSHDVRENFDYSKNDTSPMPIDDFQLQWTNELILAMNGIRRC